MYIGTSSAVIKVVTDNLLMINCSKSLRIVVWLSKSNFSNNHYVWKWFGTENIKKQIQGSNNKFWSLSDKNYKIWTRFAINITFYSSLQPSFIHIESREKNISNWIILYWSLANTYLYILLQNKQALQARKCTTVCMPGFCLKKEKDFRSKHV